MRRAVLFAAVVFAGALNADAAPFTVLPRGPLFLDDVIEVRIETGTPFVSSGADPPRNGFEVELDQHDGGRVFRYFLTPLAVGRASFGPVDLRSHEGDPIHVDEMHFDIGPPLDDGEASAEEVLQKQMRHGRVPFVVRSRTETTGRVAGRAFVIELVSYGQEGIAVQEQAKAPDLGIHLARTYESGMSEPMEVSGRRMETHMLGRWVAVADDPIWTRSGPGWITARVPGEFSTRIRRVIPPVTLEVVAPPFEADYPIGSFKVECPMLIWEGNGTAAGTVVVKGDGSFTLAKLSLDGRPEVPLFIAPPKWGEETEYTRFEAKFPISVTSLSQDTAEIQLPNFVFPFHDPASGVVETARCSDRRYQIHGRPEPRPAPANVEAAATPAMAKRAGTVGTVLQGLSVVLILVMLFFVSRTATR